MKRLFSILFLAACFSANAVVMQNLTLTGPSNTTMYATNFVNITAVDDTNTIYAGASGSLGARIYKFQRSLPAPNEWAYTNTVGPSDAGYYIVKGDGNGDDVFMQRQTTNDFADGSSLYGTATITPGHTWQDAISGSNPRPFVSFGTNYITNTLSIVNVVGAKAPAPTLDIHSIYLDATNGSDMFWQRGRPDLPMKTFSAAVPMLQEGDTLFVAPGFYGDGGVFVLPRGASVIGEDRARVQIASPGTGQQGALVVTGTGSVLKDFTLGISITIGPATDDPANSVTNAVLENLDVQGTQDGVLLGYYQSLTIVNSTFASPWDAYADYQGAISSRSGYSNAVVNIYDSHFIRDTSLPGTPGPEPWIVGNGQVKMFGGSIRCYGTPSTGLLQTSATAVSKYGHMDLYGVSLENTSSSITINNTNGAKINLHNMSVPVASIVDSSNTVFVVNRDGSGLTNVPPPTTSLSALTSGVWFTNTSGRPQEVRQSFTITEAAVNGVAMVHLITGQQGAALGTWLTNASFGQQTLSTSLATTNVGQLSWCVSNSLVYCFTNQLVGAGNAITPRPNTSQVIQY